MSHPALGKRLLVVLIWSAISAAFIGPGTVTTAAKAGASHGLSLLWALVFSTLACLTLQEASARVTIATGQPLGGIVRTLFQKVPVVPLVVLAAVVLGCAAYEMGNILGAVAGASMQVGLSPLWLTLGCGLAAGIVLWLGSARAVAKFLGLVVAIMGVAFLISAVRLRPPFADLLTGALVPRFAPEAGLLILGLVGTTVVPYNLFLGSGLARGQTLSEARLGLAVAIPLGGLISMGIVVVGTSIEGAFTFETLASALADRLGDGAAVLLAVGLLAAGLSSAITAPLAAALAVQGFTTDRDGISHHKNDSWRYRAVWGGVLMFGLGFGLAGVQPVPAIVLAQAFNGVLLPLVAVVLWIVVNDRRLMGSTFLVGRLHNIWLGFCVLVTFGLGTAGFLRAASRVLGQPPPSVSLQLVAASLAVLTTSLPVFRSIRRRRSKLET